jgi:hypothetical protein
MRTSSSNPGASVTSIESGLRRRFRAHSQEGTKKQKRRLFHRAGYAALTGLGVAAGLKYGGPRALQLADSAQQGIIDAAGKAGKQLVFRNMRPFKYLFPKRRREQPVEKLAMAGLGLYASTAAKIGIGAGMRHPGKVGAAATASHFLGGSAADQRRRKRKEGAFARRLMLL